MSETKKHECTESSFARLNLMQNAINGIEMKIESENIGFGDLWRMKFYRKNNEGVYKPIDLDFKIPSFTFCPWCRAEIKTARIS